MMMTKEQKFKLIEFIDAGRWNFAGNASESSYDTPNYADKNMPEEQKILTHFLGYITDRQTPFKLIFEKLDFIFSQLVIDYAKGEEIKTLLEPGIASQEKSSSYFIRNNEEKFVFQARRALDDNAQYPNLNDFPKDKLITGASRFYPTDYISIYSVLYILEQYGRSLFNFVEKAMEKATTERNKLESILYSLWLLGYADVGTWATTGINKKTQKTHEHNILNPDSRKKFLEQKQKLVNDFLEHGWTEFHSNKWEENKFQTKRVTCFVRDLFKFNHYVEMVKKQPFNNGIFDDLHRDLKVLELPGDVWNNNSTFRKCFLTDSGKENSKGAFNKIIRELYEEYENNTWYPEQMDCTFDFVPRMCEKQNQINCNENFCPLHEENSGGKIPEAFCHRIANKYCPFLLYACGYKTKCINVRKKCPNWPKEK